MEFSDPVLPEKSQNFTFFTFCIFWHFWTAKLHFRTRAICVFQKHVFSVFSKMGDFWVPRLKPYEKVHFWHFCKKLKKLIFALFTTRVNMNFTLFHVHRAILWIPVKSRFSRFFPFWPFWNLPLLLSQEKSENFWKFLKIFEIFENFEKCDFALFPANFPAKFLCAREFSFVFFHFLQLFAFLSILAFFVGF